MRKSFVTLCLLSLAAITFSKCDNSDNNSNSINSDQPAQSENQSQSRQDTGAGNTPGNTQVTGLSAVASGPKMVKLSWKRVPNATTYWVHRDQYVPAIIMDTSYSDGSVKGGTTYTYSIAAVVKDTLRLKSNPVTVTTPK